VSTCRVGPQQCFCLLGQPRYLRRSPWRPCADMSVANGRRPMGNPGVGIDEGGGSPCMVHRRHLAGHAMADHGPARAHPRLRHVYLRQCISADEVLTCCGLEWLLLQPVCSCLTCTRIQTHTHTPVSRRAGRRRPPAAAPPPRPPPRETVLTPTHSPVSPSSSGTGRALIAPCLILRRLYACSESSCSPLKYEPSKAC
jgi:hypothetical protein